jgi:WD40 repeat protein
MQAGIVIADADGSDSWGFDYFGQVSQVFWMPSGERVGFEGGVCWSVGVLSAEFLLTQGASGYEGWPCLDQDFEALEVSLDSPYGVVWSPLVDTLFAVQTAESIQIVDLASYAITVALFGSEPRSGPPSWSPDGQRLAFAANGGDDSEIFVLNLANNEVVRLTDNEVDDFMPAWQP